MAYDVEFTSTMFRYPGNGGWTFVTVPEQHAPSATYAWGRSPVVASVDGHEWKTSVWREKTGRTLLAGAEGRAREQGRRRQRAGRPPVSRDVTPRSWLARSFTCSLRQPSRAPALPCPATNRYLDHDQARIPNTAFSSPPLLHPK